MPAGGGLHEALRRSKDAALGLALRTFINARFAAIGEVTAVALDTADRSIRLRVALRGESAPVDVHVRRYELEERDGQAWITILDAGASREWLDALLHRLAIGQRLPIPAKAAGVLRLLA